jgi:hypothetical protein
MSGRSGYSNNAGKTAHKRKDEKDRKHAEARKYAQIPKESIQLYSETVVEKIGDDIARPLAEDISYRLREVIHVSIVGIRVGDGTIKDHERLSKLGWDKMRQDCKNWDRLGQD